MSPTHAAKPHATPPLHPEATGARTSVEPLAAVGRAAMGARTSVEPLAAVRRAAMAAEGAGALGV